ncbi:hypothetical protein JKP88DRAFT_260948 [Tribonema minus]|uniref:Prokaryotic-type class I peptide chain release factors domain-containing protein n=1 Tax=Tribonema minus TaxID=303371 RepID=A0A835ZJA0_9STRA|nr:hypothetical protein JKP88DRAFT_260948 [Tribonema minus]
MASGAAQVHIPEDRLQISFTRSSGAGGQNVNKASVYAAAPTWLLHHAHVHSRAMSVSCRGISNTHNTGGVESVDMGRQHGRHRNSCGNCHPSHERNPQHLMSFASHQRDSCSTEHCNGQQRFLNQCLSLNTRNQEPFLLSFAHCKHHDRLCGLPRVTRDGVAAAESAAYVEVHGLTSFDRSCFICDLSRHGNHISKKLSKCRASFVIARARMQVNTKVEVRFVVDEADWLEYDVRQRLKEYQAGRVNKTGELIVTCQEHRTQKANRMEAIGKLREMIADALLAPKERAMRVGIGEATKRQRRDDKRFRSKVKATRGRVRSDD